MLYTLSEGGVQERAVLWKTHPTGMSDHLCRQERSCHLMFIVRCLHHLCLGGNILLFSELEVKSIRDRGSKFFKQAT